MFDFSSPVILILASLLVGVAAALSAFAVGGQLKARGLAEELKKAEQARDRQTRGQRPEGLVGVMLPFGTALGRVLGLRGLRTTLTDAYARAGYPGGLDDDEVLGLAILLGFTVALPASLLLAMIDVRLTPLALVLAMVAPGIVSSNYNSQGNKRELAVSRTMPFVLDLLVLTMRAGASFQQALRRVAEDYREHPIGVEFQAVLTDLGAGATNKEAFKNLHNRVPIDAVGLFVDDLLMGEELGRPLAEIFERQADQSRVRRVQDAMDTAGRASVMVLVPGMLVFLAVLILLFAPFGLRAIYGGRQVPIDVSRAEGGGTSLQVSKAFVPAASLERMPQALPLQVPTIC